MAQSAQAEREVGLEKAPTGIAGLDEILGGGLPHGRTSLIVGGAGTGKTVLALQTLVNGARRWGEPGIFCAFEERSQQLIANAATFGWDLPALAERELFFLDARTSVGSVSSGEFDLQGMLATLEAKAAQMGARRIVFDALDVLLMLLDDVNAERRESYRIHDWLTRTDMTGLVTLRVGEQDPVAAERYGYMQFMADCVLRLSHRLEGHASLRTVRAVKYRGSAFAEHELPMLIDRSGVQVATLGPVEPAYAVTTERVSTGIERLDTMLEGGYYRGSSTLISGSPGTAKSTLCSVFLSAACRRGERALYVLFDESADEMVRNMASINLDLASFRESGLLHMHAIRAEWGSAEEHLLTIRNLVEEHQPQCVAIDPLSAFMKASASDTAGDAVERTLRMLKNDGITLVCSSLLEGSNPEVEMTPLRVSTIADTWIHLSYVVKGGERNRALSIVKSRGTGHSNQVREMILSDEGIALTDVYTAGGTVLMGTLRWEQEQAARLERLQARAELEQQRRDLRVEEAEAEARIAALQREIEGLHAELALLHEQEKAQEARWTLQTRQVRHLREADRTGGDIGPSLHGPSLHGPSLRGSPSRDSPLHDPPHEGAGQEAS
jgi:circadian clock protein KaiC